MFIAVDIGGTNIRVALSRSTKDLTPSSIKRHINIPVVNDYPRDLANLIAGIEKLQGEDGGALTAIGAGMPSVK